MKYFIILLCFTLFGCADTMVPVFNSGINEAGEVVKETTPYITEASVAKSQGLYDLHAIVAYYKYKAFMESGVKLEITNGKITGVTVRGASPSFDNIPMKVDEYPAWATAERVGTALIKALLWGYGINQVTGMIGGMAAGVGTTYHGDFNATQSLNNAGTTQGFDYSYAPITSP